MNFKEALLNFKNNNTIPDEFVDSITAVRAVRLELVEYFRVEKDRNFVISLLNKMVTFRTQKRGMSGDSIMLACYLLGLHKNIEDSLLIWNAKRTDFDSFCYIDIQLVPFAGVVETIEYMKSIPTEEARVAHEYLLQCKSSGDFDDLQGYYAADSLPWYV